MTTSEQVGELAAALAKAQAQMTNAALNKTNPHFRSKYADLAAIRDSVIPALAAQGIAVVQTLVPFDGRVCVATRLVHGSGQWIESLCPLPDVTDMQKMGSAITYARRYSLSAIAGIAADEDDDGTEASRPEAPQARTLTPPEGFDNWYSDLTATADLGLHALEQTWKASRADLRRYLLETRRANWEALKARAATVTSEVPV